MPKPCALIMATFEYWGVLIGACALVRSNMLFCLKTLEWTFKSVC